LAPQKGIIKKKKFCSMCRLERREPERQILWSFLERRSPIEGGRKRFLKWGLVSVLICISMIGSFISHSCGEEGNKTGWSLSLLGGYNARSKPNLITFAMLPRWDLSLYKYVSVELEGNFSYYNIDDNKDLYVLGCNGNLLFRPFQWKKGSLFAVLGAGLGYNNGNGDVTEIGDSHVAGILQGGSRISYELGKNRLLYGEYRFNHISDPFDSDDLGINTHTFILGVSF
jgi:hypothetical protein